MHEHEAYDVVWHGAMLNVPGGVGGHTKGELLAAQDTAPERSEWMKPNPEIRRVRKREANRAYYRKRQEEAVA